MARRAVRTLVLEVACGTGRNFAFIEQAIGPTGTLVGFDRSPQMLDAARGLAQRQRAPCGSTMQDIGPPGCGW
jgi:ubiquinone/menaquinone biosynthesis C-methylase UbiE